MDPQQPLLLELLDPAGLFRLVRPSHDQDAVERADLVVEPSPGQELLDVFAFDEGARQAGDLSLRRQSLFDLFRHRQRGWVTLEEGSHAR